MNLLISGNFSFTDTQLDSLKAQGYHIFFQPDEKAPFADDPKGVDGIICNAFFLYHDISQFTNLKFIQITSAGLDRLPLDYIHSHSIILYNAGDVYSVPIAEWVILKILEICKQAKFFTQNQIHHRWEKNRNIHELSGKTALILGCGNNGSEIAKRLLAFDMHTIGVDIQDVPSSRKHYYNELYITRQFYELLKKADIVVLALPLSKDTHHIINEKTLSLLKQDVVLVNIARGSIIDEQALIKALQRGKFLGIALDVFEEEPLPLTSPLWDFPNVLITPHNSFASIQNLKKLQSLILNNLQQFVHQ